MTHSVLERQQHQKRRAAHVITETLAPAILVSVVLFVVGAVSGPWGWVYGLLAVFWTTGLPLVALLALSRKGKVSTHHVKDRRQRAPILLATLVSILIGVALLLATGAPAALLAFIASTIIGLLVTLVVSLFWKISVHAMVAVFFAVTVGMSLPPWGWVALVVPVCVGWSRVVLGDHTKAQVWVGSVVGTIIVGVHYLLIAP